MLENGKRRQKDVEAAADTLISALLDLRYKADKSVLESLVVSTVSIDLSGCKTEKAAAFNDWTMQTVC